MKTVNDRKHLGGVFSLAPVLLAESAARADAIKSVLPVMS